MYHDYIAERAEWEYQARESSKPIVSLLSNADCADHELNSRSASAAMASHKKSTDYYVGRKHAKADISAQGIVPIFATALALDQARTQGTADDKYQSDYYAGYVDYALSKYPDYVTATHDPTQAYMPDDLLAAMRAVALKITYQALSTIYARSGDKTAYKLMTDCIRIARTPLYSGMLEYVDGDTYDSIASTMHLQYEKVKKYRVVKISAIINGQKQNINKRLRVIGEKHLSLTAKGKDLVALNIADSSNLSATDLIQTALLSMCEMSYAGMIITTDDIYRCKRYVYRRVNSYILGEKNRTVSNAKLLAKVESLYKKDKNGKLMQVFDYGDPYVTTDDEYAKVDKVIDLKKFHQDTLAFLIDNAGNRTDCERLEKIYKAHFIKGEKQADAVARYGYRKDQVSKTVSLITRMISSSKYKEFLHYAGWL